MISVSGTVTGIYSVYIFGGWKGKVKECGEERQSIFPWRDWEERCRGRDSNPHSPDGEQAFKARVSTDSTTAAGAAVSSSTLAGAAAADKDRMAVRTART